MIHLLLLLLLHLLSKKSYFRPKVFIWNCKSFWSRRHLNFITLQIGNIRFSFFYSTYLRQRWILNKDFLHTKIGYSILEKSMLYLIYKNPTLGEMSYYYWTDITTYSAFSTARTYPHFSIDTAQLQTLLWPTRSFTWLICITARFANCFLQAS